MFTTLVKEMIYRNNENDQNMHVQTSQGHKNKCQNVYIIAEIQYSAISKYKFRT